MTQFAPEQALPPLDLLLDVSPAVSVVNVSSGRSFPISDGTCAIWQPMTNFGVHYEA